MDFEVSVSEAADRHGAEVDALLVVIDAATEPRRLGKAIGGLLSDALEQGDLVCKAGRCLYLHRPAGLKAQRLVFAVAADATPKAFRAALLAGLGAVKGGGAKHLGVACAGALGAAHAQALAAAVSETVYVYRRLRRPRTTASAACSSARRRRSPAQ